MKLLRFLFEDHNNALEKSMEEALNVCAVHAPEAVEYISDGHYEQALQNCDVILKNALHAKKLLEKHIENIKSGKEPVGPKGGGEDLV